MKKRLSIEANKFIIVKKRNQENENKASMITVP